MRENLKRSFDNLADSWLGPAEKGVSLADVDNFAGILMDKQLGQETVEMVFNDILNRDEDVNPPILLQVFKGKTHPCWGDAAGILDVTNELPKTDNQP